VAHAYASEQQQRSSQQRSAASDARARRRPLAALHASVPKCTERFCGVPLISALSASNVMISTDPGGWGWSSAAAQTTVWKSYNQSASIILIVANIPFILPFAKSLVQWFSFCEHCRIEVIQPCTV